MSYLPNEVTKFRKELVATGETITANKAVEMTANGIRECKDSKAYTDTMNSLLSGNYASFSFTIDNLSYKTIKLTDRKHLIFATGTNAGGIILATINDTYTGVSFNTTNANMYQFGVGFDLNGTDHMIEKLNSEYVAIRFRDASNQFAIAIIKINVDNSLTIMSKKIIDVSIPYAYSALTVINETISVDYKCTFLLSYSTDALNSPKLKKITWNIANNTFVEDASLNFSVYLLPIHMKKYSDGVVVSLFYNANQLQIGVITYTADSVSCNTLNLFPLVSNFTAIYDRVAEIDFIGSDKIALIYPEESANNVYGGVINFNNVNLTFNTLQSLIISTAQSLQGNNISVLGSVGGEVRLLAIYEDSYIIQARVLSVNMTTNIVSSISLNSWNSGTTLCITEVIKESTDTYILHSKYNTTNSWILIRQQASSLVPPTNCMGVAKESKNAGEYCKVEFGDIINMTGLTKGSYYYLDSTGSLTTDPGTDNPKVGFALSTTEIKWLNPIL